MAETFYARPILGVAIYRNVRFEDNIATHYKSYLQEHVHYNSTCQQLIDEVKMLRTLLHSIFHVTCDQ